MKAEKLFYFISAILTFYCLLCISLHIYFDEKTLPGLYLGDVYIGGKNLEQVENLVKKYEETFSNSYRFVGVVEGKKFTYDEKNSFLFGEENFPQKLVNYDKDQVRIFDLPLIIIKNLRQKKDLAPEFLKFKDENLEKKVGEFLLENSLFPVSNKIVYKNDDWTIEFGKAGYSLDKERLEDNFLFKENLTVVVPFKKIEPDNNVSKLEKEIADLRFETRDLLGTGYSSYEGSDSARKKNIIAALKKIDGYVIEDGETFSLLETLSPFTEENGYVVGAAILGGKIVSDIGGGMCQLGTTLFRSAMLSGLPITERHNHTYWLHWYDDPKNGNPGTDATIYEGSKDLKFLNDTGHKIVIKVRIKGGGKLYIDFYGTSDGRKGNYIPPRVESESAPEKEILTVEDNSPNARYGCSGPFKGATTVFTYYVTNKDGETTYQNFYSFYRSMQRTCVVK